MRCSKELKVVVGEFIGTAIFLTVTFGAIAQFVLGATDFYPVYIGHTVGLMLGIFFARNLSGAHLNPAVTMALMVFRTPKSLKRMPLYFLGQFLGAFLAAAIVFGLFSDHIKHVDPDYTVPGEVNATNPTAGIFGTYPGGAHVGNGVCVLAEFIGTMVLMMTIMAVTDSNSGVSSTAGPIIISLALGAAGLGLGSICGFSVNPFRDFAPRCFTAIMYGKAVFTVSEYYFWVPLVIPFPAALTGAAIYHFAHGCTKVGQIDQ